MAPLRVIGAGFGRTGTLSMKRALEDLGFERHRDEVCRTVEPSRLLVFDVKQGWEPLCAFLDVPAPDHPFPALNDAAAFRRRIRILGTAARALPVAVAAGATLAVRRFSRRRSAPAAPQG